MDLHLLELIPFGHENAITREELERLTGFSDRVMRAKPTALREETPILNMQDGRGYFRPLEHEFCLVRLWMAQTRSRAKECDVSLKGASLWLLRQKRKPIEGQVKLDGIS